jgi:hypothetical protein
MMDPELLLVLVLLVLLALAHEPLERTLRHRLIARPSLS